MSNHDDRDPADDDVFTIVGATGFKKFCERMWEVSKRVDGGFGEKVELWQVKNLAEEHCSLDADGNQTITYGNMKKLHRAIQSLGLGVVINELAAKGIVDCCWDDQTNDWAFRMTPEAYAKYNPHVPK